MSSRKQENVQKAVEKLQAEKLNVSGMTVKTFGQLDIVVSNAAVNPQMGNILETTERQWDKMLDINIKSAFFLVAEAIPHLEKTRGSVIFVSSIGGYVPFELIGGYSVCKTALLGLIKAMAPACAEKNIRVNGLAPGIIKTKFSQGLWNTESTETETSKLTLMKRLGMPDDISGAAAFLVSDDASYITGETIVIAGGMTSRL
ncbi:hypothetical protein LSH36_376g00012 [Paralvinella palmiformis]|uniref:Dehydrogenase/reductase SDR family member 4 n=1 Tax=Paralvinella palmiformis TaxID=53620 RepID=A0AAD9JEB4_9ANNE|nr:hypothetical protein LSH36_376g00012 [Paralvinella palmiformis]